MIKHSCSWYEPMQMYILKWKMGTNLTWTLWIVRYNVCYYVWESHAMQEIYRINLSQICIFSFFVNYI